MKRIVYRVILLGFLILVAISGLEAQKMDVCNIFGSVYVTKNPKEADFVIFVEESEAFADLIVFKEDNRLFADQKGLWFFTEAIAFANFVVFITDNVDLADFTIFYIETPSFAGCK